MGPSIVDLYRPGVDSESASPKLSGPCDLLPLAGLAQVSTFGGPSRFQLQLGLRVLNNAPNHARILRTHHNQCTRALPLDSRFDAAAEQHNTTSHSGRDASTHALDRIGKSANHLNHAWAFNLRQGICIPRPPSWGLPTSIDLLEECRECEEDGMYGFAHATHETAARAPCRLRYICTSREGRGA
jgi:hypothetical protein